MVFPQGTASGKRELSSRRNGKLGSIVPPLAQACIGELCVGLLVGCGLCNVPQSIVVVDSKMTLHPEEVLPRLPMDPLL
eukprot:scaffold155414_cov26-Tisochrysis_lutea.AAC.4